MTMIWMTCSRIFDLLGLASNVLRIDQRTALPPRLHTLAFARRDTLSSRVHGRPRIYDHNASLQHHHTTIL